MTHVTSLLIGTRDADRLRAWYEDVLPPTRSGPQMHYRVLEYDGFWLMLDPRDDVAEQNREPARILINIETDDARAVAKRADARDTRWIAPLEDRDGNLFGTMADPDGNPVQIIQLTEDAKAAMAAEADES